MSDIKKATEYIQEFAKTYSDQRGYLDYSDETFINDFIYGIGAALSDDYKYAEGFREFKKRLRTMLDE